MRRGSLCLGRANGGQYLPEEAALRKASSTGPDWRRKARAFLGERQESFKQHDDPGIVRDQVLL